MNDPSILLIDEPSVGLAPILVSQMIAKIKELKELKKTEGLDDKISISIGAIIIIILLLIIL